MSEQLADVVPAKSSTHNHIGCIKEDMGLYDDAIKHYEEALRIFNATPLRKTIFIVSHEATLYNNLGSAHRKSENYQKSFDYFYRALALRMDNFLPDEEEIAKIYNNIGAVYHVMGEYDKAWEYRQKALEIRERIRPSIDSVDEYSQIVLQYYDEGNTESTIERTIKLMDMLPPLYQRIMSTASETFRMSLLRKIRFHMWVVHIIALRNPGRIDTKSLYNLSMQTKDINAEAEFVIRASKNLERYPKYAEALSEVETKRSEHQNLILTQPHNKEMIALAQQEVYSAEVSLAPFVREIDFKLHMAKMNADLILDKLPANSALLEYSGFFYRNSVSDGFFDSGGRYCVFILRAGEEIIPHYFEEPDSVINALIYAARANITHTGSEGKLAPLDADAELSELYKILIKPFEKELDGINHLYIAPDGELYKLPFELLRDESGETLSNANRSVSYLSSGRDLVRAALWETPVTKHTDAVILADPKYDLTGHTEVKTDKRGAILKRSRDIGKLEPFVPLKYGKSEADSLLRILNEKADKRYDVSARKNTLQEIVALRGVSPSIIHIVSHGFAFEKQEIPENTPMSMYEREFTHSGAEDPLLRCGMAFSGVNNWLKTDMEYPLEEYGDGILTAKDVLRLDLQGTDLLVLSACQTGLGEVKNGEGIKGLRRSFELSGVRTIICTLWSVDDLSSALLMNEFYTNLLVLGINNKLTALTNAKQFMSQMTNSEKKDRLIKMGRTTDALIVESMANYSKEREHAWDYKPYKHAFYWAGYILQGDTRSTVR